MKDELLQIYEKLKKQDVKTTEKKFEKDVVDSLHNSEIGFLNTFLKQGEMLDGKKFKTIDSILKEYRKKLGSKAKTDPNILMLAPILAAMVNELKNG